jgi:hypothetical protein
VLAYSANAHIIGTYIIVIAINRGRGTAVCTALIRSAFISVIARDCRVLAYAIKAEIIGAGIVVAAIN